MTDTKAYVQLSGMTGYIVISLESMDQIPLETDPRINWNVGDRSQTVSLTENRHALA